MTFPRRVALAAAAAVALAVVGASAIAYLSVAAGLRGQVDQSLRALAAQIMPTSNVTFGRPVPHAARRQVFRIRLPAPPLGGATGYAQILTARGIVLRSPSSGPALPIDAATRAVAAGRRRSFLADRHVDGVHVRVLTTRGLHGDVVQVARPLTEVDASLHRLLLRLLLVGLAGVVVATALGKLVAHTSLAPVRRLSAAAEDVAATEDLSRRLPARATGDDLQRLGASFNRMMAALEASRAAQQQLVADASHELRTPLTSLRANLETIAGRPALEPGDRTRIIGSAVAQIEDLTLLVGDLVDLARPGPADDVREEIRFDLVVLDAVRRARLHAPGCEIAAGTEPVLVHGDPARLHRAVSNLLENATKYGPSGGTVTVRLAVAAGWAELAVDDCGPGIAAADRRLAFARFWRSPRARGRPGAGLGLAIVKQVADDHGGTVDAGESPCGGARLRLRLPASPTS